MLRNPWSCGQPLSADGRKVRRRDRGRDRTHHAAVDDLDAATDELYDQLRLRSPQGLAETKALTTKATRAAVANDAATLAALSARLFGTAEAQEGMQAFLEKRPPDWVLS